jgi:mitochondrial fission protein ELM1
MKRVWVLTSGRTGDDKQSLRLATALGVPFSEKKIVFNARAKTWRLTLGASLTSVDRSQSTSLEAPWPDMVISTGWRQVPVVRWIKEQAGGSVRLVQMNRPPGPKHFDLVLSPPQFEVPARPNIIRLDWPLQLPPDPEALAQGEAEWRDRLGAYPHPWTVLLLGGDSYPFQLDADAARKLFEGASERASRAGGSLMISTSRRTPKAALAVFQSASANATDNAPNNIYLYGWSAEATENPYFAFLAGGDEFVVTPDSISMLVEVARLGRPLAIAPHRRYKSTGKALRVNAKRWLHGSPESPRGPIGEAISDFASLVGLKFGRDLASVSRKMTELGWAANFPEFGGQANRALPDEDFERLVERAKKLLDR